jgi:cation-transporting ATPase V/Cu+-exporting ATPase
MSQAATELSEQGARLRFEVEGMHCASCVSRVDQTLRSHPAVRAVAVNLAREEARVVAGDGPLDPDELVARLEHEGFGLRLIEDDDARADPSILHAASARRLARRTALSAVLTAPVVVLAMGGIDASWSRALQALLTAPVVFVLGAPFHRGAWTRLRHRDADMDTLVSLGTLAAFGSSLAALVAGGAIYFETAAVIVTLILLGRSFEARAKSRATAAIGRFAALRVDDAVRLHDGVEQLVPVEALEVGDSITIAAGARIPVDARVIEGHSSIDESMLTGEAVPLAKTAGDTLHAGTVNGTGRLIAEVVRVGTDTVLAQIERAVDEAQSARAPIEALVDRIAARFVPAVLAAAILTFVAWLLAGIDAAHALRNAVAVLIVACPCALGLATPTAVMVGCGRGAQRGLLFKGAEVFERARSVDTVVFDKTGTLTTGALRVSRIAADAEGSAGRDNVLRHAAAIEAGAVHPIGIAIVRAAREAGLELPAAEDVQVEPGHGASGRVAGKRVAVGREDWLTRSGYRATPAIAKVRADFEAAGATAFAVGWDGEVRGAIAVEDTLHEGAEEAVAALRAHGCELALVTGDAEAPARVVADELGIERVHTRRTPTDKAQDVEAIRAEGRCVAFAGDGINDAVALSAADLGIAVRGGDGASEIASAAADVVLLSGDPRGVALALDLARRTYRVIGQNLFWAFAYNTAAIPAAALGYLDPMLAAGAMALSSVSVVANSLRLRRA